MKSEFIKITSALDTIYLIRRDSIVEIEIDSSCYVRQTEQRSIRVTKEEANRVMEELLK